jgi:hypothetical protein
MNSPVYNFSNGNRTFTFPNYQASSNRADINSQTFRISGVAYFEIEYTTDFDLFGISVGRMAEIGSTLPYDPTPSGAIIGILQSHGMTSDQYVWMRSWTPTFTDVDFLMPVTLVTGDVIGFEVDADLGQINRIYVNNTPVIPDLLSGTDLTTWNTNNTWLTNIPVRVHAQNRVFAAGQSITVATGELDFVYPIPTGATAFDCGAIDPDGLTSPMFIAVGKNLLSAGSGSMTSGNGIYWQANPGPGSGGLPDALWSTCVYLEDYNCVAISNGTTDSSYRTYNYGDLWLASPTPINNSYNWTSMIYLRMFSVLAIDRNAGVASISYDAGDTWSAPYSVPVKAAYYQFGLIVGVSGRYAYTSTDGISWNGPYVITSDFDFNLSTNTPCISWVNGRYVVAGSTAVGQPFPIYSSTDGQTWTGSTGTGNNFVAIATTNTNIVAITAGTPGQAVRSSDGISWSGPVSTGSIGATSIAAGGSIFVIVGENQPDVRYSVDSGANWRSAPLPPGATSKMVSVSSGQYGI